MGIISAKQSSGLRIALGVTLALVLGTLSVVFSIKDRDAHCNVPHHSMDFDLSDFLLWFGVADLLIVPVGLLAYFSFSNIAILQRVGYCFVCVMVILFLFVISWSIVGAIVLFQDCIFCIYEQQAIGVISLITLVIHWVYVTHCLCLTNSEPQPSED